MKKSFIIDYIFGYETASAEFESSHVKNPSRTLREKTVSGLGKSLAKRVSENPIMRALSGLSHILCYTTVRTYSLIMLSFGLMTLLLNFAESYFMGLNEIVPFPLIVGTSFFVISLPLFAIDSPLSDTLSHYGITDFIFFEVFCLRRVQTPKNEAVVKITSPVAVIIGTVLAVIGFFLPLKYLLISLGVLLFVTLSLSSPEFCFMSTILALPLIPLLPHPSILLGCVCGLNVISFFFKVLLGKRLYHFEIYDMLLLFLFFFVLVSGIFNKGIVSFESALITICLVASYFLASNLIVNRRLADNAVNLLLFSSVPTALYAIIEYFTSSEFHPEWVDGAFAEEITKRATATFYNPNIYSVFLLVALVFSFTHARVRHRSAPRIAYAFVFAINLFVFILTWTRGAWLALLIALPALLILSSGGAPKALLIPLAAIPLALCFVPHEFWQRLLSIFNLSDSSIASRLSIYRSSLSMLGDNIFTGIGIGSGSFTEEFLKYAEDGVTAPHAHNLFLEIACEAGIFALLIFVYILIVNLRHFATYSRYIKNTSCTALALSAETALFALVAFGMTDYIFFSPVMCYLFFAVLGLCSATLRIAKNEHDADLGITGDLQSSENASIDISVG